MVDGRLVVVVYARWNTYVSGDDDDDLELYEQCFVLLIVCNASNSLWYDSLWCVMRTMFRNHEENTMSISYEMVDLENGFTKIASLGGNGQEILCVEEKHKTNQF